MNVCWTASSASGGGKHVTAESEDAAVMAVIEDLERLW